MSSDIIYMLGDYTNGYPDTPFLISMLEQIYVSSPSIFIRGNHDQWLIEYLATDIADKLWLTQGGQIVYDYYKDASKEERMKHLNFLENATVPYYIDMHNNVFVHGGYYSAI